MNKRFALFKKSDKFYWSTNTIIYSILFSCLGIILFKQKVLNIEENLFDKIFIWIIAGAFCFGMVLKLIGMTKIEPLRGILDGYLTFEKDLVRIKDEVILLEEIKKIQISNDDYIGKRVNISKGNFGTALSNGTNNFITILLESGKTKRYQFELINSNDFQNIRATLIEYCIKKKIDFWQLANLLGEKNSKEIAELTREIETISTNNCSPR